MTSATQLSQLPTKFSGLRYLAFKSQVLVSSGITSLDSILGGGIPLGTILLIEEDEYGVFSEVIMKYFYAEGVACKHSLFVASDNTNIIYQLPQTADSDNESDGSANDYKMKIAWRYQTDSEVCSKPSRSAPAPNFGHNFDLTASVPPQQIETADITVWPKQADSASYKEVVKEVAKALELGDKLVRVGLHSVGSSSWLEDQTSLPSLFYALRSIVHNNRAVLLVTLPTHLIKSECIVKRCEDLSDTIISLESLVNNSNPLYADYKGLIQILKYPSINSLSAYQPEANDWAFKLHRRKFVVEKLHIPPEIESSDNKEQKHSSSPLCSRPMGIDF